MYCCFHTLTTVIEFKRQFHRFWIYAVGTSRPGTNLYQNQTRTPSEPKGNLHQNQLGVLHQNQVQTLSEPGRNLLSEPSPISNFSFYTTLYILEGVNECQPSL
ncbi:hypothetical protein ILYODFUR_020353 [Ilyodon furcidens]|uniref:Uncharacterized protein n=1 Tax=Ilyodon furcidens TaxID=33524 RepID=A0ABV0SYQ2_9TELE